MTRSFLALSALSALSALVRALSLFTGTVRAVRALFILGREMRPSAGRINNPSAFSFHSFESFLPNLFFASSREFKKRTTVT